MKREFPFEGVIICPCTRYVYFPSSHGMIIWWRHVEGLISTGQLWNVWSRRSMTTGLLGNKCVHTEKPADRCMSAATYKSHFRKPQGRCECYSPSRGHTPEGTHNRACHLLEGMLCFGVQRCGGVRYVKTRNAGLQALRRPRGEWLPLVVLMKGTVGWHNVGHTTPPQSRILPSAGDKLCQPLQAWDLMLSSQHFKFTPKYPRDGI